MRGFLRFTPPTRPRGPCDNPDGVHYFTVGKLSSERRSQRPDCSANRWQALTFDLGLSPPDYTALLQLARSLRLLKSKQTDKKCLPALVSRAGLLPAWLPVKVTPPLSPLPVSLCRQCFPSFPTGAHLLLHSYPAQQTLWSWAFGLYDWSIRRLILFFLCECFACMYVCIPQAGNTPPPKTRKGCWIPKDWS